MKILHIVPEFEEGGVERYVLSLIHAQVKHNHEITLATAGGKLEKLLPEKITLVKLPVQKKNLFTGIYCAVKLFAIRDWDIIHAHSRVPAWIAWLLSSISGIKWLMTAHAPYSINFGILPLRHADGIIFCSDSVEKHLRNYLRDNKPETLITIPNGFQKSPFKWQGASHKLLFVGYLSKRKGLDIALNALGNLLEYDWTLDILGDGSERENLELLVKNLGINSRVKFFGFRDDPAKFMSESGCLLFPSYQEGLPLTVNEALSVGIPVLASDIEPLRAISDSPEKLIPPGDVKAWENAIKNFLESGESSPLSLRKLISFDETVNRIENFYARILL